MYDELHKVWKRELESVESEKLTPEFYFRVADYIRHLKEEGRMLDKRTAKAQLLKKEMRNVKRMVHELVQTRYKKLLKKLADGEKVLEEVLTDEERKIGQGFSPVVEAYQDFEKSLLRGQMSTMEVRREHKVTAVRFLKDVPEIIGADMKSYGPFKIEDVASLPIGNAKILIRQSLVEEIEVN